MLKLFPVFSLVVTMAFNSFAWSDPVYRVADKPWEDGLGHQRAVIEVSDKADAVHVRLNWRRRDTDFARKAIIVIDAATGKTITNVIRGAMTRQSGELVFQPQTAPGTYFIYYLPFTEQKDWGWYSGDYLPAKDTADPEWAKRVKDKADLPQAKVIAFESRTEFDRVDPMEIVASADEVAAMKSKFPDRDFLLFPEDRTRPIRMTDDLPLRWTTNGPSDEFHGEADQNEYYAFQIGVYASRDPLAEIAYQSSAFTGSNGTLAADRVTCFNLEGVNIDGNNFTKSVSVPAGKVQALWFGIDVPRDAAAGEYHGTITISAKNAKPQAIAVTLTIAPKVLADRGDSQPWRFGRLRWLNSTLGEDDTVVPPYTPVTVDGKTVGCLGRQIALTNSGLPEQIHCGDHKLLASPITFSISGQNQTATPLTINAPKRSTVTWDSHTDSSGDMHMIAHGSLDFDGTLHYTATFHADHDASLSDVVLDIPLRRDAAKYFMGIGHKGGFLPGNYTWHWDGPQDSFWIGDVHGGIHCEFRGSAYNGPMLNLYHPAPPPSWFNNGKGTVSIIDDGSDTVTMRASTGPRNLKAGENLSLEFALLITPVKPLDTAAHFNQRYYHNSADPMPTADALAAGANIVNVHHATPMNPFINYPFLVPDNMKAFVDACHAKNCKVKIYYTVRELTSHTTELPALRSLGTEVLADGGGGGYPWQREHLIDHYTPAWYTPIIGDGYDFALTTAPGDSRWYNYYVEGLNWLVRNVGIDGLYLDDVSYDRRILLRMRRVMQAAKPNQCLIDLHSNTLFSIGPANQYTEFFPYIDRTWFGEGFDYNHESPDYWLVEVSGIPFGLMGDMLQDGGNRWLGMLYGMTARLPWTSDSNKADPKLIWKEWDSFGIADAKMIGYWEPNCPVHTDNKDVLATAYVKNGKTLIALGSWAKQPVNVKLTIDFKALGIDESKAKLTAPAIQDFQEAKTFSTTDSIPVDPLHGWLLVLD